MTLKLESTTTWTRKRLKLGVVHHLTHITCVQKLRGLRQKLDVLRVQTGPSLSKYKGFRRKLICYKEISFFHAYFNSRILMKFQPFLTSFAIFLAFNDLFL